jgi:predicted acylesterase/phospholipase RssA/CRP-like cAMP-binding protein
MQEPAIMHLFGAERFAQLDADAQAAMVAECRPVTLASGEKLFTQGDPGDSLYVLHKGRLGVRMHLPTGGYTELDELYAGVTVGEMALITGQPRVATVFALEASELVQFSRAGFDRLAASHPEVVKSITEAIIPRLLRTQLADALTNLFGPFEKSALHELQAAVEWRHVAPGTLLFQQGDLGDGLYIVINGRLRAVTSTPDGSERVLGEVGRGECVGEIALLTGEPRMATVYAVRESDVVRLSHELFARLLERYPQAMLQIARLVARRAQQPVRKPSTPNAVTNIVLLPAGPDVPLTAFAQRLEAALSSYDSAIYLDAQRFDNAIGKDGAAQTPEHDPANLALLGWFSQHATRYRYSIYLADYSWTEWTRRCLHQADRLLIVGQAGADPTPGPMEQALADVSVKARPELVLLHPDDAERPTNTLAWLTPRDVFTHHHLRLGNRSDIGRLVRRLTGRAVGLVLGGGGARGHVHSGVIRALHEAGIEVDMIAGTSMGAVVGGAYAVGNSWQQLVQIAADFSSRKKLVDLTLPLVSFAAGKKVTRFYQHLYGDLQIEDLWQPFFCMSSNLTRAEPLCHQRGSLWAAVRASSAIPGIFAPVLHENGDVLVDGGVMNNFPLDIMREQYEAGVVIGVSAAPTQDKSRNYSFGSSVSGWRVLLGRLGLAKKVRVPALLGSMMRTIELNSVYVSRSPTFRSLADVIIQPPVEQFRVLDFDAHAAIIEAGYQAAREQIAAWQGVVIAHPAENPAEVALGGPIVALNQ